jgi:hypothetical protein
VLLEGLLTDALNGVFVSQQQFLIASIRMATHNCIFEIRRSSLLGLRGADLVRSNIRIMPDALCVSEGPSGVANSIETHDTG